MEREREELRRLEVRVGFLDHKVGEKGGRVVALEEALHAERLRWREERERAVETTAAAAHDKLKVEAREGGS